MVQDRPRWASKKNFVLAAAGSAIGLGNIWKFPYVAGENGGGVFVLIYLLCVLLIGAPLIFAEMYIGQKTQSNAFAAFKHSHRSIWKLGGVCGCAAAFLMLTYYFVVGGWILNFLSESISDLILGTQEIADAGYLGSFMADPVRQVFWHTLFTAFVLMASVSGFKRGIESLSRFLMPLLFVLLGGLLVYSWQLPGFARGAQFLFRFDWAKFNSKLLLDALGNALFTLSLGIGVIITYGSYLKDSKQLVSSALSISVLDTLVAIGAAILIFTVAFSFDHNLGEGPGLIFSTLPVLFSKMPQGQVVAVGFFILILFAAFSSAISAFQVNVQMLMDEKNYSLRKACLLVGFGIYSVGIVCDLSPNLFAEVKFNDLTLFATIDFVVSNVLLPISALFVSSYFGWVVIPKRIQRTNSEKLIPKLGYAGLVWSSRILTPAAVVSIMAHTIFA